MKDKYNNMSFKNILRDFLDFDNAYKTFMLSSFSGSKLNGGVYGGRDTPPNQVSDHKVTVKENLINVC